MRIPIYTESEYKELEDELKELRAEVEARTVAERQARSEVQYLHERIEHLKYKIRGYEIQINELKQDLPNNEITVCPA